MSAGKSARLSIREIAELSLFCALMVAGKECLRLIPNVHPVTLLLLLATVVYGAKALYPAFGFALLEIALYGAGLWNLMYLYVWPIVVLAALPFRRSESRAFWAAIAGLHGLCFGALWASSAFPAPAPCDTLRVAFLTDIHVTPGNVQDSLFRVAVDEINASPCDIVIFGGDLTNLGSDAELEYVHGLISRLEKPWHAVPGNHETTWSESACTAFARIFGHDGRTAFRAGDYLFLGYASGPFMKMAMGAVRTEDLAWLAAEAAKARPGQRIVSLCHYPLNNDLTNRTEVTATLRRLGIPLTLFGHYHRAPSLFNFDSIAGIQGRALRGKSDSDAGYTLLDFWGDSVRVREKTLGAEPRTRFTIRMQDDPQTLALASDPTPPVPDYKAHAQLVLQDSATIYTGPAFYRDLVYYGTTQGVLRACDTRRNREVWRQRFGGALYTTPLVAEGLVIAGTTTDGLRAYDARTGRER